ncbi:MAG: DUF6155 family protein [Bacteroidales bacterium]|nr:DUF6155 family protein [Bacteroidales bacterium]MCF8402478.1 DUF6155 family protein [Bacteroidales bacterium]
MSKRELKRYLHQLPKPELEEQILDLYAKFKNVKVYYDFVFKPNERKLIDEAKFKIYKEYFPQGKRKPKARRSVAQKMIKHFKTLGVEPQLLAEVMVFNLETALDFSSKKMPRQEAFYISILRSYKESLEYFESHNLSQVFFERMKNITEKVWEQGWFNKESFG